MKWLGKYQILDDSHSNDLERASHLHETSGIPREQAENAAYCKYRRLQCLKAAAHHLDGMNGAKSKGLFEDGKRHFLMYSLHLKSLALNPFDSVSPEVTSQRCKDSIYTKFKEHPADIFVLDNKNE
jgi:hypothetical protein